MDELDYAFKAFKEYKELMDTVPEVKNFLSFMNPDEGDTTSLESLTTVCIIDMDWVNAIQKGMPFVMDAVMENRQFVRSDGVVLPIEKIRVVGKESISDLAKHSNYITKKPEEGGLIVPDKLMMPLKDNDFAIYENRFLYTLLVYLSQFIEIRLNEILAITSRYQSKTKISLNKTTSKRHMVYELSMEDSRFNDPYASNVNGSSDAISLIKQCLNDTKAMLMTPLMKIVSKAPMVSSPIVKTNVFRFDHNFKESLALFEYLQSYSKKGFTIKDISKRFSPFSPTMSSQYAEMIYLTSFLGYVYGNDLTLRLRKQYEANKKEEARKEEDRILSEIKRIERDISRSGVSKEEYILLMEKGQKILEKQLRQKDGEIQSLQQENYRKLREAQADFEKDLEDNAKEYEAQLEEEKVKLEQKFHDEMLSLNQQILLLRGTLEKNEKQHILDVRQAREEEISKYSAILARKEEEDKARQEEMAAYRKETEEKLQKEQEKCSLAEEEQHKLEQEKFDLQKEVDALREMNHLPPSRDLTEKENFLVLEKEKEAFDRLFKRSWKETKKRIRKKNFKH